MSEEKDKDIRLFKEAQTRGNLGLKVAELEKTQITKVFYEQWVDKLTALDKEISEIKLNQTDGTPNQNFIAIRILKDGMNTIGIKIENRFNKIESMLDKYFKYRKTWSELIMKKRKDFFPSALDTWLMISLHKLAKESIKQLDGEKSVTSERVRTTTERGKSDSKPLSICSLKEQRECYSYKTILCLSPKITTCMHGKTKLEKEQPSRDIELDPATAYARGWYEENPSSEPSDDKRNWETWNWYKVKELKNQLISEFLRDWQWGKAFEKHKKSHYLRKNCRCGFTLAYWRWFEEKWQKKRNEK